MGRRVSRAVGGEKVEGRYKCHGFGNSPSAHEASFF